MSRDCWISIALFVMGVISFVLAYVFFTYNFLYRASWLMLLFSMVMVSFALLYLFFGIFNVKSDTRGNVLLSVTTFLLLFFLIEVGLRLKGDYRNHAEVSNAQGKYYSLFHNENKPDQFWVHPTDTILVSKKKEFTYERKTNSIGLSEREIEKDKNGDFRIIILGDSFTEGVGVEYDSTWIKKTERMVSQSGNQIEFINAGIGGSDPVFEYVLLRDKLLDYQPDQVIMTLNSSDYWDVLFRGGLERFSEDGSYRRSPPSWEWIYALNHMVRWVVHDVLNMNHYLMSSNEYMERDAKTPGIIMDVIKRMKALSSEHHFDFRVIVHPVIADFEKEEYWDRGLNEVIVELSKEEVLLLDMRKELVDIGVDDKEKAQPYYWPLDGHFNPKGCDFLARCLARKLNEGKNE